MKQFTYEELISNWFECFGSLPDKNICNLLHSMEGMTVEQIQRICEMVEVVTLKYENYFPVLSVEGRQN